MQGFELGSLMNNSRHELVERIRSSMGELGSHKGTWEEAVEAYQKMSTFSIGDNPELETRLDHITDHDGWGDGKHSGICIDGVFAYLVYYKGKHILTVAFSVMGGKKILLGQVQTAPNSKGWGLSLLPRNRLEFVIDLFLKTFVGYQLFLVDGKALVDRILNSYRASLKAARVRCKRYRSAIKKSKDNSVENAQYLLDAEREYCKCLRRKIEFLTKEKPRLISFYQKSGRFRLIRYRPLNGLMHHWILG